MRALVLSSGGSRIAYHAGVVKRLFERGLHFDLYAGASAGALVAAVLAQYTDGEAGDAARHAADATEVDTPAVWRPWPWFGNLAGLWKPGLVDGRPFRDHVRRNFDLAKLRYSGKRLRVAATQVQSGFTRIFDEHDPRIESAIAASASIPGIFAPVKIDGTQWWDGGLREGAPIKAVIDAGATEVWCVMLRPEFKTYAPPKNAISAAANALDIMQAELLEGDIYGVNLNNILCCADATDKRLITLKIIRPTVELLPSSESFLTFSKESAARLRAIGYNDTRETVG